MLSKKELPFVLKIATLFLVLSLAQEIDAALD